MNLSESDIPFISSFVKSLLKEQGEDTSEPIPSNDIETQSLQKSSDVYSPEKNKQDFENIRDVDDGNYYQEFISNLPCKNNLNETNYSFIMNTDGLNISVKSNISIWPVYLAINEIPIETRYFIDNILIAGIYNFIF